MNGSYDLNSFKNGVTLNKGYIIGRMNGNGIYGLYTSSYIEPNKLLGRFC